MKLLTSLIAAALLTAASVFAAAGGEAAAPKAAQDSGKVETFTGWGQCAKCSLGLTASCQNALVVTKDGKEETFFLAQNPLSQDFHSSLCSGQMEIAVTGTAKGPVGEREIVATKIEAVKKK
jgi:hypothetical protein